MTATCALNSQHASVSLPSQQLQANIQHQKLWLSLSKTKTKSTPTSSFLPHIVSNLKWPFCRVCAEHGFRGIPADLPEQNTPWNQILCPCLQLPFQHSLYVSDTDTYSHFWPRREGCTRDPRGFLTSLQHFNCVCLEADTLTLSTYPWCIALRKTMVGLCLPKRLCLPGSSHIQYCNVRGSSREWQ